MVLLPRYGNVYPARGDAVARGAATDPAFERPAWRDVQQIDVDNEGTARSVMKKSVLALIAAFALACVAGVADAQRGGGGGGGGGRGGGGGAWSGGGGHGGGSWSGGGRGGGSWSGGGGGWHRGGGWHGGSGWHGGGWSGGGWRGGCWGCGGWWWGGAAVVATSPWWGWPWWWNAPYWGVPYPVTTTTVSTYRPDRVRRAAAAGRAALRPRCRPVHRSLGSIARIRRVITPTSRAARSRGCASCRKRSNRPR